LHVRAVRCSGALACVGSGDHTGRLIQFLFSTELCPWITFGGQVSGHHCRSGVHKAGVCVGWVWHALQGSAQGLMYWAIALEDLRLPALGHARRRSWASKHREVHSLDCLSSEPSSGHSLGRVSREILRRGESSPLFDRIFYTVRRRRRRPPARVAAARRRLQATARLLRGYHEVIYRSYLSYLIIFDIVLSREREIGGLCKTRHTQVVSYPSRRSLS
jgi:hypothetical protein